MGGHGANRVPCRQARGSQAMPRPGVPLQRLLRVARQPAPEYATRIQHPLATPSAQVDPNRKEATQASYPLRAGVPGRTPATPSQSSTVGACRGGDFNFGLWYRRFLLASNKKLSRFRLLLASNGAVCRIRKMPHRLLPLSTLGR